MMAIATAATADLNEGLAQLYKTAGIDPQEMPEGLRITEADAEAGKEQKEATETVVTRTVNINGQPRTYTGATAEEVLAQVAAAVEAAQPAPQVITEKKVEPKTLDATKAFEIGLELQKGNVKAIETYLDESGYLERQLASRGLTLDSLKNAVSNTATAEQRTAAETAATAWLNREGNDWPGGKGNMKILGFTLSALGLKPGEPESYQKSYEQMKAEGMVLPNPDANKGNEPGKKKQQTGSTAFATGAENNVRQPQKSETPTISRAWWDKLKPFEQQAHYNELVSNGHKPEDVKFVA